MAAKQDKELELSDFNYPTERDKSRGKKQKKFLDVLVATGNMSDASRSAQVHRSTVTGWIKNYERFAEDVDAAKAEYLDSLVAEADRRATKGVEDYVTSGGKVVLHKGKPVIKRRFSDNLLMFRIKKLDPSYRDRLDINQSGAIDHRVEIVKFSAEGKEILLNENSD